MAEKKGEEKRGNGGDDDNDDVDNDNDDHDYMLEKTHLTHISIE